MLFQPAGIRRHRDLGQWQDLPSAITCVITNRAKATRLNDCGRIAVNLRSDLVRIGMLDGMPPVKRYLKPQPAGRVKGIGLFTKLSYLLISLQSGKDEWR